jgi:hypothetical protein
LLLPNGRHLPQILAVLSDKSQARGETTGNRANAVLRGRGLTSGNPVAERGGGVVKKWERRARLDAIANKMGQFSEEQPCE